MQAAARLAEAFSRAGTGPSETDSRVEEARRAGTDHEALLHEALLNALPIASAVIGRAVDKRLLLVSYNQKFADAVSASTCTAGIQAEEKACLQTGPIAELMQRFFDGEDSAEELEFRDGEGISARYFRIKLAPLPARRKCDGPRCLLSLVDRTVEVQAERALRAEMLRDSLTGLPNRLAFTDFVEKAGDGAPGDLEHEDNYRSMHEFNPLKRGVEPYEVAAAVRFLAATPTVTGEILTIDGGQRFWGLSRDVQYLSPYGDSDVSERR